jgi:hypothetical protein
MNLESDWSHFLIIAPRKLTCSINPNYSFRLAELQNLDSFDLAHCIAMAPETIKRPTTRNLVRKMINNRR